MNGNDNVKLLEYLRAVRRRWKLVLFLALLVTAGAVASSLIQEKRYEASTDLLLRQQDQVTALLTPGVSSGSTDPERDLNTSVELVKTAETAQAVRRRLGLSRSHDALLAQIDTETSNTSNIITLSAQDRDPRLAASIANAFAEEYVRFRVESARARYEAAAELAARQLRALGDEARATAEGRELQSRQRELEIAAALQTGGVEVVRAAGVPTAAASPRPKLSGAVGLVIGLLFGLSVALALELLDRRFKDEGTVESFFELPVLAAIPRPPRRGGGLNAEAQGEAYGLLAANLRMSSPQGGSGVLMVTSSSPGEGKTSVTFGIARACARLGLRVIAIEADLRRPTFSHYTDVSYSHGLTGVLGSAALEDELLWLDSNTLEPSFDQDEEGTLAVLPSGALPLNPQRVLSQPAMQEVIERCREIADIVLLDTAPAGTVNDPLTMAHLVDGVVLVARLNATTKEAARRALRVLRNIEVEIIGVVVTNAAASERYGYYSATSKGGQPVQVDEPAQVDGPAEVGVDGRYD